VQAIPCSRRITLGGDKHYDIRDPVDALRSLNITPHVAQNHTNRKSAIDRRTTRHLGYALSMRERIEEIFGWLKTVAVMRKTRHKGSKLVGWIFTFSLAAYHLVRMRHLVPLG
jgi:hypothetical protein